MGDSLQVLERFVLACAAALTRACYRRGGMSARAKSSALAGDNDNFGDTWSTSTTSSPSSTTRALPSTLPANLLGGSELIVCYLKSLTCSQSLCIGPPEEKYDAAI